MKGIDAFSLNVLIVEDDLLFAIQLEMLLEELGYKVKQKVDNSVDALRYINQERPDLILMDIEIKGKLTGLQIGEEIKDTGIPILYITSSMDDRNYELAQNSNMIGYLVKPINKITLRTAIQLAISKTSTLRTSSNAHEIRIEDNVLSKEFFYFKKRETYRKVSVFDIAYIEADQNYCKFNTCKGDTFSSRIGINQLEEMLPAETFVRIHRKYIVNLRHVDAINMEKNVVLVAQDELPYSRRKKSNLVSALQLMN